MGPRMTKRAHISLRTKLASALLALRDVPYSDAKAMTADQIISLYQFHHGIQHGVEVVDEFWNLTPMMIAPHRARSPADSAVVRRAVNLSAVHEDFRRRVLAKPCGAKRRKTGRIPSRPWPKRLKQSFTKS